MEKDAKPVAAGPEERSVKPSLFNVVVFGALSALVGGTFGYCIWQAVLNPELLTESTWYYSPPHLVNSSVVPGQRAAGVKPFATVEDFKSWLAAADSAGGAGYGYGIRGGVRVAMPGAAALDEMSLAAPIGLSEGAAKTAAPPVEADRYSTTNVQVAGVDEPDIVKTDGKELYFSPTQIYWYDREVAPVRASGEKAVMMPPRPVEQPGVQAIKAFPPADLKLDGEIDERGDLLLSGQTLVVFGSQGPRAYDVSDPSKPVAKWQYDYEAGNYLAAARLYGDKIYLVLRAGVDRGRPCPIVPLASGDAKISIPCGAVYHPVAPVPSDVTYSAVSLNAASGTVDKMASFVGSSSDSIVYMSPESLYVTYVYSGDFLAFFIGFVEGNPDLFDPSVKDRLRKLQDYDISDTSKMAEVQIILERWAASKSGDDRLKFENEVANRMETYQKDHQRDLQRTGIVKLAIEDLAVIAAGSIPGAPLNQFALDEYGTDLRVATTTGGRRAWQFGLGTSESVNDVYVLDGGLRQIGSALDMGKGERIYSVRFVGPRGYVVTFKETDPFYVLDLAVPSKPEIKGELKIPGYSSYLHPIGANTILGLGKEGGQVKISLFDVADPAAPSERAKYTLDEYWSDVLNNHHAFLLDERHEVFFMPGGKGGYVFSYKGGALSLARAVGDLQAKRAIYIGDQLYVIGEDQIVVLNENDWKESGRLKLR